MKPNKKSRWKKLAGWLLVIVPLASLLGWFFASVPIAVVMDFFGTLAIGFGVAIPMFIGLNWIIDN